MLCRVEGDAAMGGIMRRHWLPVGMSEEVAQPNGKPVRSRLLGEDLVVFRDSEKRLGALGEFCLHRRASLAFGRNEDGGLRCLYHGWKFDVEGNVVDMPCEAPGTAQRLGKKTKSYPVREWGDMIWAYMGPAGEVPELPALEMALLPPSHRYVSKKWQDCNWVQSLEGAIDTSHFSFLHMVLTKDDAKARAAMAKAGRPSGPDIAVE